MTLFAGVALAGTPSRALDQLDLKIWNTDQGLPHNSVLSIGQTSDGMLWVGTWGGLARFDGVEFRTYDRDNTPAIGDNGILTMIPSVTGGLWIGTHRGGLLRVEQGRLERVVAVNTSIASHVLSLLEVGDSVWIGTEGAGLYRWRTGELSRLKDSPISDDDNVYGLSVDPRGGVVAGTRRGAFHFAADGTHAQSITVPAGEDDVIVVALHVLESGVAWLATSRGLYRRDADDQEWKKLSDSSASSMSFGRNGQVWVGTHSQGVIRIDGQTLQQLRTVQGLPDSRVRTVLEDRNGGIWLGTNGGLVGLQSLPFSAIGTLQGLSNDYVRSMLQTADGTQWIATARGLNRYLAGKVERLHSDSPLADMSLLSLAEDTDGTLWVGSYADGVFALRNGVVRNPVNLILPNKQIRAIVVARDRTLWIGSQLGPVHYDPRAQKTLPLPAGVPGASVMALHEDLRGRLWIGTSEGMSRIDEGRVVRFGAAQGFPAETVFSFLEEDDGKLWIGSDAGLVRFADERFDVLGPARGLPFYSVLGVQRDPAGFFWLASGNGVLRVNQNDVYAALLTGQSTLQGRLFDRNDGMPSTQCNGGAMPATARMASGDLWFATARGVAIVSPDTTDDRTPEPPNVVINRISIDERDVPVDQPQTLAAGRHTIAVQFAAISLSHQGSIENAYRVLGLDDHWERIGAERSLRLNNLAPGDYVLEVAARLGGGELTREPKRFTFSIEPMIWQHAWFLLAAFVTALLLTFAMFRWRTARLRHRSEELQRRVGEQTQALAREMSVIAQRDAEKSELLRELEKKSLELERLAREDGLTGVANRRYFDERMRQLPLQQNTQAINLAIMLFDLDHFKNINDSRSHHIGDLVLQRFAVLLREEFIDGLVARYGGEEFAVAVPAADIDQARARAERLRQRVESESWQAIAIDLAVTVSVGVAFAEQASHPDKLLAAADARLYTAKRGGRNRVE